MTIDRQRIEAVKLLQELGYRWDGTTWVSDASVGIMGVNTVPIAPQPAPAMHVQGAVAGLCESIRRLRSEVIRHCFHPPVAPGHAISGVLVDSNALQHVHKAVLADAAGSLAMATPAHPKVSGGLFRLDGVEFYGIT